MCGAAEGCAEPLVLRTSPLASVMTASVGLVPSHGFISGMDEKPWKSGATMVSIVRLVAWRRTKRVDEIDASKRSASSIDFPRMLIKSGSQTRSKIRSLQLVVAEGSVLGRR